MKFKQKKITCDKKLTITYTYYLNLNTFHSRTSPFDLIFTNNWMQSSHYEHRITFYESASNYEISK